MTVNGTKRSILDVRFSAASGGTADIKRVQAPGVGRYDVTRRSVGIPRAARQSSSALIGALMSAS